MTTEQLNLPEQSGASGAAAKPDTETVALHAQQAPAPLTPQPDSAVASTVPTTGATSAAVENNSPTRKPIPSSSPTPTPASSAAPAPAASLSPNPASVESEDGSGKRVSILEDNSGSSEVSPLDFQGNVDSNNDLPSPETIRKIDNYIVLDRNGKSHTFRSLYTGKHVARRVLVIFVRHFYCGNCQDYLRSLSSAVSPTTLLALPIPTFIVVIGCGDPGLIDMYTSETNCPFPVYADPTRKLYAELGMIRTLALGQRPAYMQQHILKSSVASVVQGLKQIKNGLALKGGDSRQIGGEFLFEPLSLVGSAVKEEVTTPVSEAIERFASLRPSSIKGEKEKDGPDNIGIEHRHSETPSLDGKNMELGGDGSEGVDKVVSWCHRMKNTRDHAEIPELLEVLGVEGDEPVLSGRQAPQGEKERERWERAVRERKGTGFSVVGKRMSAEGGR
ncbi:AhpC/TSA antioxidant enzyme-domain-containing protein [Podospora australis]|uniref:AhpC/TSA antioxidant enzyme-domain-containing protein n=1 Tax=Podospora australis TaxID=1536484 RepID=A0AAN7ALE0_9PEZI|nr:AhpC/TSA antioxidant enzyme-domain-containing protein [Podospora australis]